MQGNVIAIALSSHVFSEQQALCAFLPKQGQSRLLATQVSQKIQEEIPKSQLEIKYIQALTTHFSKPVKCQGATVK